MVTNNSPYKVGDRIEAVTGIWNFPMGSTGEITSILDGFAVEVRFDGLDQYGDPDPYGRWFTRNKEIRMAKAKSKSAARLTPAHVHEYLAALDAAWAIVAKGMPKSRHEIKNGKKYLKVYRDDHNSSKSQTIHAYIDKSNGDLLKASGWNGPQRDKDGLAVRGNLADDHSRSLIIERLKRDPHAVHGDYLYK